MLTESTPDGAGGSDAVERPRPSVDAVRATLRRRPDIEGPDLVAVDGADRLILDEARPALASASVVVTIDDAYGALTLPVAARSVDVPASVTVRAIADSVVHERALAANAAALGDVGPVAVAADLETALAGAEVVLWRLPRGLDALDATAAAIASYAAPSVAVVAGARDKYLTPAMNDVLARHFASVSASRGRQKARVLRASVPRPDTAPVAVDPVRIPDVPGGPLTVVAQPGVFAGASLDIGTRFLLGFLDEIPADARRIVDLGCGTGVLAATIARSRPDAHVIATDVSAAAVASARATADANGVADRVEVLRDDAGRSIPDGSVDAVVCNPPFHVGAAVHSGAAHRMFASAGRMVRPGGVVLTVFNSPLDHRRHLARSVGPTVQVGRNRKFTVTRSQRVR